MSRPKHDAALEVPDWDPDRPKGEQIHDLLLELVRGSTPGTLLPSERSLADRLGVARMTVRQCVDALQDAGLVDRLPGRGTFVREPRVIHSEIFRSFSEDMLLRGMRPGSRDISVRTVPASQRVAAQLGIADGAPVYRVERLRTADDVPMALERVNLSADRFPGLARLLAAGSSLHQVLAERFGTRLDSAEQRITIAALNQREAAALEVPEHASVFSFEGCARDSMGRPVEYGRSLYRADRYEILLHISRPTRPTHPPATPGA